MTLSGCSIDSSSRGLSKNRNVPSAACAGPWTFAGTRENRTLAHQAGQGGVKVRFDALSVRAPFGVQLDEDGTEVQLTDHERAVLGEGMKFHACIPAGLLDRTIVARLFAAPLWGR